MPLHRKITEFGAKGAVIGTAVGNIQVEGISDPVSYLRTVAAPPILNSLLAFKDVIRPTSATESPFNSATFSATSLTYAGSFRFPR
jgi:hypothetical protein